MGWRLFTVMDTLLFFDSLYRTTDFVDFINEFLAKQEKLENLSIRYRSSARFSRFLYLVYDPCKMCYVEKYDIRLKYKHVELGDFKRTE